MSKSCKDCLHYEACKGTYYTAKGCDNIALYDFDGEMYADSGCEDFTNKSEWVHLLCNIGKKFFKTIPWRNIVDECAVSSLTKKADKTWKIRLTSSVFRTTFEITINDIGKTVFLTREEAEKALEGMK